MLIKAITSQKKLEQSNQIIIKIRFFNIDLLHFFDLKES